MTQAEARNAVKHIKLNLGSALKVTSFDELAQKVFDVMMDVDTLDQRLGERKPATPNARPVTAEELAALRASSNVVAFRPAA